MRSTQPQKGLLCLSGLVGRLAALEPFQLVDGRVLRRHLIARSTPRQDTSRAGPDLVVPRLVGRGAYVDAHVAMPPPHSMHACMGTQRCLLVFCCPLACRRPHGPRAHHRGAHTGTAAGVSEGQEAVSVCRAAGKRPLGCSGNMKCAARGSKLRYNISYAHIYMTPDAQTRVRCHLLQSGHGARQAPGAVLRPAGGGGVGGAAAAQDAGAQVGAPAMCGFAYDFEGV